MRWNWTEPVDYDIVRMSSLCVSPPTTTTTILLPCMPCPVVVSHPKSAKSRIWFRTKKSRSTEFDEGRFGTITSNSCNPVHPTAVPRSSDYEIDVVGFSGSSLVPEPWSNEPDRPRLDLLHLLLRQLLPLDPLLALVGQA